MNTTLLLLSAALLFSQRPATSPANTANTDRFITTKSQSGNFSFFRTHRQGHFDVAVTWGYTSPDATSFHIERTYQDPADPYSYWEDVSTIVADQTRNYRYQDENVLPGLIYYRVTALLADGNTVVSELSSVKILVK